MNVSLRALAWATRFFWIIALAFAITCVYSATLMQVNLGEPAVTYHQDVAHLTLPIHIENGGYYTLTDVNITTIVSDDQNMQISLSTSCLDQISPQENLTLLHDTSLDQARILEHADYLVNDSVFSLTVSGLLKYAGLIPFGFQTNTTIPWGAPLHNLSASGFSYEPYNLTHLKLSASMMFQNHSPYLPVEGNLCVEILNGASEILGTCDLYLDVHPNEDYRGEVELLIPRGSISSRIQVQVTLDTTLFTYGPAVMLYE